MKGTCISAPRTTQCQEVAESLRVSEVNVPGTRLQVRAEMGAHPAERVVAHWEQSREKIPDADLLEENFKELRN